METVTIHSHKLPIPHTTKESGPNLTKKLNTNCIIPLKIYHQNIRGLRCKTNELMSHLQPVLPQILCFMEHPMNWEELQEVFINNYKLVAYFCRTIYTKVGVCMYAHKSLKVVTIDIENHCKGKDPKVCAIKLIINSTYICIITTYRAPSGNFNFFISK
jgi:hypothetical protein